MPPSTQDRVADVLMGDLSQCRLCPQVCNIDRFRFTGPCGLTAQLRVADCWAGRGEERFLSGHYGSGMMFFAGCTHACVFCQNHEINLMRGSGKSSWQTGIVTPALRPVVAMNGIFVVSDALYAFLP